MTIEQLEDAAVATLPSVWMLTNSVGLIASNRRTCFWTRAAAEAQAARLLKECGVVFGLLEVDVSKVRPCALLELFEGKPVALAIAQLVDQARSANRAAEFLRDRFHTAMYCRSAN